MRLELRSTLRLLGLTRCATTRPPSGSPPTVLGLGRRVSCFQTYAVALPPCIEVGSECVYGRLLLVQVAMNGQTFLFPSPDGSLIAIEVSRDFFPRPERMGNRARRVVRRRLRIRYVHASAVRRWNRDIVERPSASSRVVAENTCARRVWDKSNLLPGA